MLDLSVPITIADLLTPAMILVVGLSQVGVVLVGVFMMRTAAKERSQQMEPLIEGLRLANESLREVVEISRASREAAQEAAKNTRELLLQTT